MRDPAKHALCQISAQDCFRGVEAVPQRKMMSVELLLVGQSFKVGLDGEIDHGWRVVGEILLQRFRINGGGHVDG